MSESSLVTKKAWANKANYEVGRAGYKIKGIVIHHAVTTNISAVDATFANASRRASAHYTVSGKEIHQHVSEANTAWHCGNWYGNHATVGIETVNSTLAPDYKVSDQSLDTLIKLVADIAKRNKLGKLWLDPKADYPTLSGHKDWYGSATACPGPYLYPKLQYIADKANAINYPPKPAEPTAPTWKDITPAVYETTKEANLYNVVTGAVVSSYKKILALICFSKCAFSKTFANKCLTVLDFKQQVAFICPYSYEILVYFITRGKGKAKDGINDCNSLFSSKYQFPIKSTIS